jgi:hypothetical protein
MSSTSIYPSPSKINGIRPGNHLGINGDASHEHTLSSPEQGLRNGIKEQFYRVDTLGLKKRLLGAIGGEEEATEYWGALAQFLKGKMRRDEFERLVKPVLDTSVKREFEELAISDQVLTNRIRRTTAQSAPHGHHVQRDFLPSRRTHPNTPNRSITINVIPARNPIPHKPPQASPRRI